MSVLLFVVGIILFIGLIIIHEYGHFIAARRNGVEVEEFGIFFPPRLYRKRMKGGWDFTINALPLGGFVKLKGEHDSDTQPGSFGAASTWVKTKIMAAGVFFNLITGLLLLTFLALAGMPKLIPNQFSIKNDSRLVSSRVLVGYIDPGSPAAKASLQSRDQLVDIGLPGYSPVGINSTEKLPKVTRDFAGKEVIIYFVRDGEQRTVRTTLLSRQAVEASRKTGNPKGYLGISPSEYTVQRATWSAPVVAVGLTGQVTALTFNGIGHALAGLGGWIAGGITGNTTARNNGHDKATQDVGGPIAIVAALQGGSGLGMEFMLFVIAVISLTLAIMNILPIPALDGGRLWLILASRTVRRPLTPRIEEAINAAGFLLLIGLIILITIVDVKRFF